MRPQIATATATVLTATFLATTAVAGEFSGDTQNTTAIAPSTDWSGFYGGLIFAKNTGYHSAGLKIAPSIRFPSGDGSWSGLGVGLVIGHNWQREKLIYGIELAISNQDVSGKASCLENPNISLECEAAIEKQTSLRARLGILTGPKTLAFTTLGIVQADVSTGLIYDPAAIRATGFPETIFNLKGSETFTGGVYGIGVEHAFSPKFSLRGSILTYDFQERDTKLKSDFTQLGLSDFKIGLHSIELTTILRF